MVRRGMGGGGRSGRGSMEGKIIAKGFINWWIIFMMIIYLLLFICSFSFKIYCEIKI